MKNLFYVFTLFIILTRCGILTSDKKVDCGCCEQIYINVDSALKCGAAPSGYKSFLFALVNSDIEKNQAMGWDILNDKDIIETAKRDYVLIIIEPEKVKIPDQYKTKEFLDILKQKRSQTYFVVTNRVFYPFREFTLQTDKGRIINDLGLGEGP